MHFEDPWNHSASQSVTRYSHKQVLKNFRNDQVLSCYKAELPRKRAHEIPTTPLNLQELSPGQTFTAFTKPPPG